MTTLPALPITHPPFPLTPLPLPSPTNEYLAWFDGACGPVNPGGTATFGVVVKDKNGTVLLKEHSFVGKGRAMSNNLAEYAAVLHILRYLSSRPPGRVTIHGDSDLVVKQLTGKWRIRKGLYLSTAIEAKELLAQLHGLGWQITCRWIPRVQNKECDALSNKDCHARDRSRSQKARKHKPDGRDALMIGRTIKTTGITVLRADLSNGADWWVCRCSCGREFLAHGWSVRHGRTRHCGAPDHEMQHQNHPVTAITMPAPNDCPPPSHACETGHQAMVSC